MGIHDEMHCRWKTIVTAQHNTILCLSDDSRHQFYWHWQQTQAPLICGSLLTKLCIASRSSTHTFHYSPVVPSHWPLWLCSTLCAIFYRALLFNSCPAMMSSIEVGLHPVVRVWQQSHENGDTNHRHRAIVETVTPMIGHQSQTSTHANHSPTWHSLTESQQVGHRVIWERSRWQQFLGRSIWQNRDFTFKRTNNGY